MTADELVTRANGAVSEHAPFGARTTYRVGGTARYVLKVNALEQLTELSEAIRATNLPVITMGYGSNLLVADEGFDGVVIELGDAFDELHWHDQGADVEVTAGAALGLPVAARRLGDAGIVGFEWAVGVPGSIGGAAVMNAGGHGGDMAHVVRSVATWSCQRHLVERWSLERLNYGYRHSALRADDVVTSVTLRLRHGDAEAARSTIREIVQWRRANQPGGANAGSVFRNPPGAYAGQLIEQAGCKGLRRGTAQVSEKHANFIQVDSNGRAGDVLELMREVRRLVLADSGVELVSELRLIGFDRRWP